MVSTIMVADEPAVSWYQRDDPPMVDAWLGSPESVVGFQVLMIWLPRLPMVTEGNEPARGLRRPLPNRKSPDCPKERSASLSEESAPGGPISSEAWRLTIFCPFVAVISTL